MALQFTGSTSVGVVVPASNDTWITLRGQYVSSSGDAFDFGSFDNVEYLIQGDVYAGGDGISSTAGANYLSIVVGEGASITAASDAIELLGTPSTDLGQTIVNNGTITALALEGVDVRSYSSSLVNNGLITAAGYGVYFQGNSNTVTNNGTVTGDQVGIGMVGDFVDVTNLGIVSSTTSYGIDVSGDNCEVENLGTVVGEGYGVDMTGNANFLMNSGSVTGDVGVRIGANVVVLGGASSDLRNDGTITGYQEGITVISVSQEDHIRIVNTGEISVQIANGAAINCFDEADDVVNAGVIDGDVNLGGGNDIYRGGGEVRGQVDGGDGSDTIRGGVTGDSFDGGAGSDTLVGKAGDDTLWGDVGNDTIRGGADDDLCDGGGGRDELRGGRGDDELRGGGGNDVLIGGAGDDILNGGNGADVFMFAPVCGFDTIVNFEDGIDKIDLTAFGIRPADFSTVVLPALENTGGGDSKLNLTAFGGDGFVIIGGLTVGNADASDFLL